MFYVSSAEFQSLASRSVISHVSPQIASLSWWLKHLDMKIWLSRWIQVRGFGIWVPRSGYKWKIFHGCHLFIQRWENTERRAVLSHVQRFLFFFYISFPTHPSPKNFLDIFMSWGFLLLQTTNLFLHLQKKKKTDGKDISIE